MIKFFDLIKFIDLIKFMDFIKIANLIKFIDLIKFIYLIKLPSWAVKNLITDFISLLPTKKSLQSSVNPVPVIAGSSVGMVWYGISSIS